MYSAREDAFPSAVFMFSIAYRLVFFCSSTGEQTKKRQPPEREAAVILITNKTIYKKSSHNPYTQDYARFFV